MSKTIEITLDEHCAAIIKEEIAAGSYKNASEMVHQAIVLLEKQSSLKYIESLIKEGENSGKVMEFDRDKFIAEMKRK